MQFKVPQDVQREDTIIGPLTLKQMAILGVGGGIAYTIYVSLAKSYFMEIWLPPVAIVTVITLAVAFLKIHNLPFWQFLMYFIEYHVLPKERIWIQGTGYPFVSPFQESQKKEKKKIKEETKKTQSLEEITRVLDSHGEAEITEEKSKKKEELQKIINHQK